MVHEPGGEVAAVRSEKVVVQRKHVTKPVVLHGGFFQVWLMEAEGRTAAEMDAFSPFVMA